ncbi:hypothetical protein D3C79_810860 [compost metagenome]
MFQHRRLRLFRTEKVQSGGAKQQRLHAGDFNPLLSPPVFDLGDTLVRGIGWFRKVFSRCNVYRINPEALQELGNCLVLGRIPGDVGNGQPHAFTPELALTVGASDCA